MKKLIYQYLRLAPQPLHLFFISLLFVYAHCFGGEPLAKQSIVLNIPSAIKIDSNQDAKKVFTERLQGIAKFVNQQKSGPILGIAPYGGSKVTPFKELGLDGLVIVDFDRPGTPAAIQKTFTDSELRKNLITVLEEALNNGAMNSSSVMSTPITAQLLARLWYELGVNTVHVRFYLPKNVLLTAKSLQLWDGKFVDADDIPLVTRYSFDYEHKQRELVFVTSAITGDSVTWRDALPLDILHRLAPNNFQWGYLSADGLVFFSAKSDNGLSKGNTELVALLHGGAGVVLEYPYETGYTSCNANDEYNGIFAMCGRADLEKWGMKLVDKIAANNHLVFGYAGYSPRDEVRVYSKVAANKTDYIGNEANIFSYDDLLQIGDDFEFVLTQ